MASSLHVARAPYWDPAQHPLALRVTRHPAEVGDISVRRAFALMVGMDYARIGKVAVVSIRNHLLLARVRGGRGPPGADEQG
jgi:hypothetical protein